MCRIASRERWTVNYEPLPFSTVFVSGQDESKASV